MDIEVKWLLKKQFETINWWRLIRDPGQLSQVIRSDRLQLMKREKKFWKITLTGQRPNKYKLHFFKKITDGLVADLREKKTTRLLKIYLKEAGGYFLSVEPRAPRDSGQKFKKAHNALLLYYIYHIVPSYDWQLTFS